MREIDPLGAKLLRHHHELAAPAAIEAAHVEIAAKTNVVKAHVPVHRPEAVFGAPLLLKTVVVTVAKFYGVKPRDLLSRNQTQEIVWPRQIAMYLCMYVAGANCVRVARVFDRNHATVIHAINKVRGIMDHDKRTCDEIELLKIKLGEQASECHSS